MRIEPFIDTRVLKKGSIFRPAGIDITDIAKFQLVLETQYVGNDIVGLVCSIIRLIGNMSPKSTYLGGL